MRTNSDKETSQIRVELKYCERCGSLWVREGGGGVYCENCQPKVAELPVPKKRPGRVKLPVRPRAVVDDYEDESSCGETSDFEAAGGVA